jgi:oxaloacetate decarboxylase gamma subunit
MATSSLMSDGLTLMFFGMGFVFVFLTLLVAVTSAMSWLVMYYENKYDDHLTTVPPAYSSIHMPTPAKPVAKKSDKKLMTVISAAIHQYRQRGK